MIMAKQITSGSMDAERCRKMAGVRACTWGRSGFDEPSCETRAESLCKADDIEHAIQS